MASEKLDVAGVPAKARNQHWMTRVSTGWTAMLLDGWGSRPKSTVSCSGPAGPVEAVDRAAE